MAVLTLGNAPRSMTIKSASGSNALQGSKVVAPLKDDEGAQTYDLGKDLNLKSFNSLLIHCEKYAKLWGGAALR